MISLVRHASNRSHVTLLEPTKILRKVALLYLRELAVGKNERYWRRKLYSQATGVTRASADSTAVSKISMHSSISINHILVIVVTHGCSLIETVELHVQPCCIIKYRRTMRTDRLTFPNNNSFLSIFESAVYA